MHYVWECKLVQPVWKTVWRFLKKSKIELPHDPTIPLLIFTQRKQKHWFGKICFTAAFFTIVKTWQQARCPSVDEWIKTKKLYTHTHTHTHIYIYTHTYIIHIYFFYLVASLVAQMVKNLPATQETSVRSLGQKDPWRRELLPTPVFLPGKFHG